MIPLQCARPAPSECVSMATTHMRRPPGEEFRRLGSLIEDEFIRSGKRINGAAAPVRLLVSVPKRAWSGKPLRHRCFTRRWYSPTPVRRRDE